jgi:uncharacterized protein YbjT (DUF2867 family)
MPITLGLNVNPFVNRFADPQSLIDAIAGEIGIAHVQLTHEFINPAWAPETVRRLTDAMAAACAQHGVKITSLMTGPYGRLNHSAIPTMGSANTILIGSRVSSISRLTSVAPPLARNSRS